MQALVQKGEVSRSEMALWLQLPLDDADVLEPYARRLDQFLAPARQARAECDVGLRGLLATDPVACLA